MVKPLVKENVSQTAAMLQNKPGQRQPVDAFFAVAAPTPGDLSNAIMTGYYFAHHRFYPNLRHYALLLSF
jgi:hypothetical protein